MFFKKIETKGIAHFSYMIGDGDSIAVIDPRRDVGIYMEEARRAGMKIRYILETHRNEDYVIGSLELSKKTGAKIYISGHEELGHVYGQKIKDGFKLEIGSLKLKALHTPGHTRGHLSFVLYQKDDASPYMVFTGDCLFMGDVGRTDFYGEEKLEKMTNLLYESIFEKLLPLGDEVLMFPAHGEGSACGESMESRPFSTIGYERKHSEILQFKSRKEFVKYFSRMRIKPRYFEKMEKLNTEGAPFIGGEILINPLSFEELKENKEKVILIDIRSKEAYLGGHIPGSIYMSKKSISTFLGSIFKTEEKIIFITDEYANNLEDVYWYCRRIGFDNIQGFFPNSAKKWESQGQKLEGVKTISAEKYLNREMEEDFILLDVRREEEFQKGDPEKNRINIPLQSIYKNLEKISYDTPIYMICNSGEKATIGYSYLKPRGYKVKVITGGADMIRALKGN